MKTVIVENLQDIAKLKKSQKKFKIVMGAIGAYGVYAWIRLIHEFGKQDGRLEAAELLLEQLKDCPIGTEEGEA